MAAAAVLYSIFRVPSAGEGSDRPPNIILPEEYWHNEELRKMAATGQMATTRVRFFFRTDEQGKTRVYGVHTGEGTPYERVRTGEMTWSAENRRYEFSPHPGQEPLVVKRLCAHLFDRQGSQNMIVDIFGQKGRMHRSHDSDPYIISAVAKRYRQQADDYWQAVLKSIERVKQNYRKNQNRQNVVGEKKAF